MNVHKVKREIPTPRYKAQFMITKSDKHGLVKVKQGTKKSAK